VSTIGVGSTGDAGGLAGSGNTLSTDGPFAGDPQLEAIASGSATIESGTRGDHVKTVQSALIGLGYEMPRWGADGAWGNEGATALKSFQSDNGLAQTGVVNSDTLLALDAAAGGGGSVGDPASGLQAGSPFAGNAQIQSVLDGATFANGSRGEGVRLVQQTLIDVGIEVRGGADGWYGSGTGDAVRQFQAQAGLPETGILNDDTLLMLDRAHAFGGTVDDVADTSGVTPGTTVAGAEADGLQNARFAGVTGLDSVAAGNSTLRSGSRGAGVESVQRALMDLGFALPRFGADGAYGSEMTQAVNRFQLEMGIPRTGTVNEATLEALDRVAPPPGKALERRPDYEAIFDDGRADMTIAIGYDEHGTTPGTTRKILRGLRDQGFREIDPSSMSSTERDRLGLSGDRFIEGPQYFHRTGTGPDGNEVDYVLKVITPDSSDNPAEVAGMFQQALEQDEIVHYNGHARYGTGPDFDDIHSGAGNFVINEEGNSHGSAPPSYLQDAINGRDTDLASTGSPDKYQLVYFNACSTDNYLENLRGRFPGRTNDNTDFVTTTIPTYLASGADHTLNFVSGILEQSSINEVESQGNDLEVSWVNHFGVDSAEDERRLGEAGGTVHSNGFLGNPGNRLVDSPN
jgi:peptidoglycan hydrolase-like protein with peptidoglycan-binding domain